MATVKRTYKLISKTEVETYPRVNGQVLGLYDADGLYYDVDINGNPDTTATQIVRRWVSGVKVVTELPDPAAAEIEDRPREGILYINIGGEEDRPDGTPLYTLHVWSGSDWLMVGSNYLDEDVKTVPTVSTKFYITGSPSTDELVETLLKNCRGGTDEKGVYVTVNEANQSVLHAEIFDGIAKGAAHAETADLANYAKQDNTEAHNDIDSYYLGVSTTPISGASGTVLTLIKGNGGTSQVQIPDTTYGIFNNTNDGLVSKTSVTAGSDPTGLLLTGSGWMPKADLSIGTAEHAVKDTATPTAHDITSYVLDASGNGAQATDPASKITVTYGNGQTKDINLKTYSVFSTSENGLVPAASGTGDTNRFLKGDGHWTDVPTPSTGDATKYLAGDGTWKGAFTAATASAAGAVGLVPAPAAGAVSKILSNEGWVTNGTGSTNNDSTKLYLVGAAVQGESEQTNSNKDVYILNSRLYQKSDPTKTEDFVGDGDTTSFALTFPADISQGAVAPIVTIDGVTVSSGYSIIDNALVFTSAPTVEAAIEITYAIEPANEVVDVSSSQAIWGKTYDGYTLRSACAFPATEDIYPEFEDTFTGDGSNTIFNLSQDASNLLLVTVADRPVPTTDYTFVQGEEYSDEAVYAAGDYCVHENDQAVDTIWRCTTAITTPGTWDVSNWTPVLSPILSPDLLIFNNAPASGDSIVVDYDRLAVGTIPTSGAVSTFVAESVSSLVNIANTHVNNEVAAPYYDSTVIYNVGSYCMFQDTGDAYAKLYKCTQTTTGTVTNPEDFNLHSEWTSVSISGELQEISIRVPTPPTANGTYTLTATVSGGTTTYSWV